MSFLERILYYNIKNMIEYINLKKSWNINSEDYINEISISRQKRCLSRIWDSYDWDINKQCSNPIGLGNLCFRCLKKNNSSGIVSEYPDEDTVLIYYRKGLHKLIQLNSSKYNNRNIDKEININIYQEFINREKISKKKSIKKSSMNIVFKKTGLNNSKTLSTKIIYPDKEKIVNVNKSISKIIENKSDILSDWWNSEYTDKIIIRDTINATEYIVAREYTSNGNYILNKNQLIIGTFKDWEDTMDIIPDDYKNHENIVLDPNSAIPLQEYIIYDTSSMYHELTIKVYRCYRFDEHKNSLVYTNEIEYL